MTTGPENAEPRLQATQRPRRPTRGETAAPLTPHRVAPTGAPPPLPRSGAPRPRAFGGPRSAAEPGSPSSNLGSSTTAALFPPSPLTRLGLRLHPAPESAAQSASHGNGPPPTRAPGLLPRLRGPARLPRWRLRRVLGVPSGFKSRARGGLEAV